MRVRPPRFSDEVLRTPSPYVYNTIHAGTRVSADRGVRRSAVGSERGRCTERMHDEAPQSTATLRDRRFVAVLHLVGEKEGSPPVSECLSSTSRTSISSERYVPVERDFEVRASRLRCELANRGGWTEGGRCVLTFIRGAHGLLIFRCFFFPSEPASANCHASLLISRKSPRNSRGRI